MKQDKEMETLLLDKGEQLAIGRQLVMAVQRGAFDQQYIDPTLIEELGRALAAGWSIEVDTDEEA